MTASKSFVPTPRSKIKRLPKRAHYDRDTVYAILDAGFVCHVGYLIGKQPFVTPTAYWREGDAVYWHGSSKSRALMSVEKGANVCLTVTLLDGLVVARSGFHKSVNYRSAMLFGKPYKVEDPADKLAKMEAFVERVYPGRWKDLRPVTKQELKATTIVGMSIDEASAKVRTGPPVDDEPDYALPIWGGVVPVRQVLGEPVDDGRLARHAQAAAHFAVAKGRVKPPRFAYLRATTLDEALDALQAGEARLIAGGQSLVPMLNFRLLRPSLLVDINRVAELDGLEATAEGGLRIGALTRHHKLETSPLVRERYPVLAVAAAHIGHLAIRNRGTTGGSLSHADPAAELLLMGVLLDATLTLRSKAGLRKASVPEHIAGALSTNLGVGEILAAVELPPLAAGTGWGFEECARRTGDFALAAAGVLIERSDGRVARARVAVSGGANGPVRIADAEAALRGSTCDERALRDAVEAVRKGVEPNADLHASPQLRHRILGALLRRTCNAAWARSAHGDPAGRAHA